LILSCIPALGIAQSVPFPAPGHEGLNTKNIGHIDFDNDARLFLNFWTQNRVMYNLSNVPGPGGTTFQNTKAYDFFRQRFRAALDVRYADSTRAVQAGVYTQLEYRGGWGGSSPAFSDPRTPGPDLNPYNFLQARGVRYGFVYFDYNKKTRLAAGILPLTDNVGRVLFDADWDFNVGGVTLGGPFFEKGTYRMAYVRLLDGVGALSPEGIQDNGNFVILEAAYPLRDNLQLGGHLYGLTMPASLNVAEIGNQWWLGLTLKGHKELIEYDGLLLFNAGKMKGTSHQGFATKWGLHLPAGRGKWSLMGLMSTGDESGEISNRFVTLHQIVQTAGYWGMAHIYTPNGPSDVNDFGLEPGNRGAGLLTVQAQYGFPLPAENMNANVYAAWFQAMKDRNNAKTMGVEFGGMLTFSLAKYLNLEVGGAYATVGDHIAPDADGIFELFSRFQFAW
ncbi:MAG: hypothetical protein D6714_10215, partial [Bacteroidetes bacterium]